MVTASLAGTARRSSALFLLLLVGFWTSSAAFAGSVFDDDYVPPGRKTASPATPPPPPAATKPAVAEPAPSPTPPAVVTPPVQSRASELALPSRSLLPPPAPAEQARSRRLFKEAYAEDLKHRTPADRRSLASKLLAEADKIADNACDRFVLLIGACDAASEGGDLRLVSRAADTAASLYDIDAMRLSADAALKAPLIKPAMPAQVSDSLQTGLEWESAFVQGDDYSTAARLLTALQPLAAGDPAMESVMKERNRQLNELRIARDRAEAAVERLKKVPDDKAASTALGEFVCFVKVDFEHGLQSLARTDDAATRAVVKRDLTGALGSDQQIALGDEWWELANKSRRELFKPGMRQRAVFWYTTALAGGQVTGLRRTMLEKRVAATPLLSERAKTIDLLMLVDPSKDAVSGDWSLDTTAFRPFLINRRGDYCRIQFGYRPPEEYDFRATFTYTTGNGPIILICPLSEGAIMWNIESNRAGFESHGKQISEGKGPFIAPGKPFTSMVKVRKDKIEGYLNDRLVSEFDRKTQEPPILTTKWELPATTSVGIGVSNSDITFSKIELAEISGVGSRVR